jgi:hypothetical protein
MKKILALITCLLISQSALAGGVDKVVCKDKTDKVGKVVKDKKGNVVQVCKTIKVHKKLEGDKPVPSKG